MEELASQYAGLTRLNCSFKYIQHELYEHEKPYYYSGPLATEEEPLRTNLIYRTVYNVAVTDVRPLQEKLDVHRHGVEFLNTPDNLTDEALDAIGLEGYLQRTSSMLRFKFNAQLVLVYNYRFRASKLATRAGPGMETGDADNPDEPATHPHIDHTKDGGIRRARRHMTNKEADRYLNENHRIRIVNIWRPLRNVVRDSPLAFCDFFTIQEQDLVAADRVSPQYQGEVYYLANSDRHRWFFLKDQKPSEMALFVSFDSVPDSGPAYCPHASFQAESIPNDSPGRESLEIRAIVVTELQKGECEGLP